MGDGVVRGLLVVMSLISLCEIDAVATGTAHDSLTSAEIAARPHFRVDVAEGVTCHAMAAKGSPVVKRFAVGETVKAVMRTKGKAVPVIKRDAAGKSWFKTTDDCYVPADRTSLKVYRPIAAALPIADAEGDYQPGETRQFAWRIVESTGVPCRLNGLIKSEVSDGAITSRRLVFSTMPVVVELHRGDVVQNGLAGYTDPLGPMRLDTEARPWVLVHLENGTYCFVRANKKYIEPIAP